MASAFLEHPESAALLAFLSIKNLARSGTGNIGECWGALSPDWRQR